MNRSVAKLQVNTNWGLVTHSKDATKLCTKCGLAKSVYEFGKHKQQKTGLRPACKDCAKALAKKHREENPEHHRTLRGNRKEYISVYMKEYRIKNKEKLNQQCKDWAAKYPWKVRAKTAVSDAIRKGVLVRPDNCEECGNTKPEAHHDDYNKQLDVRWLCRLCHKAWHNLNGEGKWQEEV